MGVAAQLFVRLLRTVGGGREAVGAQSHPRQKDDQRDVMKDLRIADIARRADDQSPDALNGGGFRLFAHS